MTSYGWLLDPKRCIECRACEVACKQWNHLDVGVDVRFRRVHPSESGTFPQVRTQALSLACNHCEKANCMGACPAKAIWRRQEDGVTVVDREKCLGCGECLRFCPYQVPRVNPNTRKMEKCYMCFDRVEQKLEPACVAACPTEALRWGPWDEVSKLGVPGWEGFTNPEYTRPHIRFIDSKWGEAR